MVDFSFDLANFKDEIDIMQGRRDYLLLFINHVNAELGAARLAFNGAKTRFKDAKGPLNAAEDEAPGDGTSTAQARGLARTAPPCQNYDKLNICHDMKSAGELALDACDARDSLTVATASNADQKEHIQELVSSVKKAVTDLYHARTNHQRAQREQAQAESTRVKELSVPTSLTARTAATAPGGGSVPCQALQSNPGTALLEVQLP